MTRKHALLAIALAIMLFFMTPTLAQEQTAEPAAEATAAPDTTTVIAEDGSTVNIDAPETNNIPTLINLVIVIIAAIVGGGSFAVIWSRIRTSKEAKDTIEKLYEGLSPTWQPTIERSLKIAEELIVFAREVTDRQPNTPPLEPPPSATWDPQPRTPPTASSSFSEPHR